MRVRVSLDFIMNDKRPCKSNKPKERVKILDDFDHCVIKRIIYGLYSWKIVPTVSIIHKEIKYSIDGSSIKYNFYPHPKNDNKIGPKC
jgi:hypothetical protein